MNHDFQSEKLYGKKKTISQDKDLFIFIFAKIIIY